VLSLAHAKDYSVTKAMMKDHVRLADTHSRRVHKNSTSSAFSYAEARRYLEGLPDRLRS